MVPPKVSFVGRGFLWCPLFRVSLKRGSLYNEPVESTQCMMDSAATYHPI